MHASDSLLKLNGRRMKMDDPLLEIHKLLKDFENELSKIREFWK